MTHLKPALKSILICALLVMPGLSVAAPPHVFSSGDPILASEVNGNFTDLDTRAADLETQATDLETRATDLETRATDLDTRVGTVEATVLNKPNFSGYGAGPSVIGSPKNTVVLEEKYPELVWDSGLDDYVFSGKYYRYYLIRSYYETDSETININGTPTARTHIWQSVWVDTDQDGNINYINRYRESPDDLAAYTNGNTYTVKADETSFDPTSLVPTIDPDDYTETFTCGDDGVGAIYVCNGMQRLNSDNSFYGHYSWARIQSVVSGPYTINGMTFNDVRFESYSSSDRFRIRAKGIGMIFQSAGDDDDEPYQVIYYHVEGQSGGSLVGTPFEPGVGVLDGLFF
jgi:hypothetical protein